MMNSLFMNNSEALRVRRIKYLQSLNVKSLSDYEPLKDIEKVMKTVTSSTNPGTQSNKLFHIIEFLKLTEEDELLSHYQAFVRDIKASLNSKIEDTRMKETDIYKDINLKDLQKLLLDKEPVLTKGNKPDVSFLNKYQDFVLMCMYLLQPALRNDFANLKIITKKELISTDNYLVVNARACYVYLNQFKNAKSFGPVRIDLDNKTILSIRYLIKLYKQVSSRLIPSSLFNHVSRIRREDRSEEALRKHIKVVSKHYFDIDIGVNQFRHLWEIHIQSQPGYSQLSYDCKKKLHSKLLHSVDTALKYNRV